MREEARPTGARAEDTRSACPWPDATATKAPRAATVLAVDDDPSGRYVVARVLREAGYRVLEAASGADALALASAETPDLVVLDVRLPDADGFEVCRTLKSRPPTAATPSCSSPPTSRAGRIRCGGWRAVPTPT
jgi:response regulator RpfG family c-di-GMP phosphodiesterase